MTVPLSNSWVWKESRDWKLSIHRQFSPDKLHKLDNIVKFYNTSDFAYRPKLLETGEDFLREEFIEWEIINTLSTFDMATIVNNIADLHKYHNQVQKLKDYLIHKSEFYVWTMASSESIKNAIAWYLHTLLISVPKDATIHTGYIHKDIRPWNVIKRPNDELIFIDWEWVEFGHILADVQKIIHLFLQYDTKKLDVFMNNFAKKITEDREIVLMLDAFYYMMTTWLHLSKWKIDLEEFQRLMDFKFNSFIKWKLI